MLKYINQQLSIVEELIISYFIYRQKKNDWQIVGLVPFCWTDEAGILLFKSTFVLFENGLRQRKMETAKTKFADPKSHNRYTTDVFPWLKGANVDGMPPYRDGYIVNHIEFKYTQDDNIGKGNEKEKLTQNKVDNIVFVDFGKRGK